MKIVRITVHFANNMPLQKNSTSPIHANCYETTDMDHVLGVHFDIQNPKIND